MHSNEKLCCIDSYEVMLCWRDIVEGPLEMETNLYKKGTFAEGPKYMEIQRFYLWFSERQGETGPFLVLRDGEKDFARYANIYFAECISNCCIKNLPASLLFAARSIYLRF